MLKHAASRAEAIASTELSHQIFRHTPNQPKMPVGWMTATSRAASVIDASGIREMPAGRVPQFAKSRL